MDEAQMQALIDRHISAEGRGDIGLISRENVWLDIAAVADQLS